MADVEPGAAQLLAVALNNLRTAEREVTKVPTCKIEVDPALQLAHAATTATIAVAQAVLATALILRDAAMDSEVL